MMVTIDGPAGSGKSTVARLLAKRLGFVHLNSGQIFRALTAACWERGLIDKSDEEICELARNCEIRCLRRGDRVRWVIDDCDVTSQLLSSRVVRGISRVAALGAVRERAKEWQVKWAIGKNAVVEGRDAGSSVFKSANVKIYLTAALSARAKRRWEQLEKSNELEKEVTIEQIEADLKRRDLADTARTLDPLICPEGAIYLDTTEISARAAAAHLFRLVRAKLSLR